MLGLPFHYRDDRTTPEVMSAVHADCGRSQLYARTGIQTMAINTLFQLRAEAGGAAASVAERIAMIPDLLALWLTGTLANELTVASTTGLLEAGGHSWALDVVRGWGFPQRPFAGEVVEPGFSLGPILEARPHRRRGRRRPGARGRRARHGVGVRRRAVGGTT